MSDPIISIRKMNARLTERNKFDGSILEAVEWLKKQKNVADLVVSVFSPTVYIPVSAFLNHYLVSGIVPKFYTMDPKTEDLLSEGKQLSNGMKILIENPGERGRPEEMDQDWMRERVMVVNRWCTVSDMKVVGRNLSFVGVYDDGVKVKRSYSTDAAWLVKIDSLKKSLDVATERYNEILNIIKVAFGAAEEWDHKRREGAKDAPSIDTLAENATKAILGSLG